jgi:hypothetical protein
LYVQDYKTSVRKMNIKEFTFEEGQRRSDLLHKLKQSEINLAEANELRGLLEREKQMISQHGSCLPLFAVTFLISYVDE